MKYAVVGCGWLGLPVAEKWVNENKTVFGTTTTESKIELLESVGIKTHLLNEKNITENADWLKETDVLLLCIPPSHLKEKYADFLLAIVQQLNSSAKTIMISSTSVYGDHNQIADEKDPMDGTGRNSLYVIEAEEKLRATLKNNITTIRFSGLVGLDRNPAKQMQGRTISGGNEPVNLIHLNDCIGVIEHVIKNEIWGETVNASAPINPLKKDFYTHSAEKLNIAPPIFETEKQDSKRISSSKIINDYKYQFIYPDPFLFP